MNLKGIINFNPVNRSLEISIHILTWMLTALAGFAVYLQFIDTSSAIARILVNITVLIGAYYFNHYLFKRYFDKGYRKRYFIIILFALLVVICIRIWANVQFVATDKPPTVPEEPAVYITVISVTTVIVFLISGLVAFIQCRNHQEKIHLEKINQLQLSQLKFLQGQLNPHVLFNSLNNIYALVLAKSDEAPEMLVRLSNILRYSIYQSPHPTVEVEKEVEQIESYIQLFQLRSKRALPVRWTCDLNHASLQIPPMLLISLIENAFKHGDILEHPDSICQFQLYTSKDRLEFTAVNTFKAKHKDQTGGIGLNNIRQTLEILFAKRFTFEHGASEDRFNVILTIDYGS